MASGLPSRAETLAKAGLQTELEVSPKHVADADSEASAFSSVATLGGSVPGSAFDRRPAQADPKQHGQVRRVVQELEERLPKTPPEVLLKPHEEQEAIEMDPRREVHGILLVDVPGDS